jgi:hypothetical protein
MLSKSEYKNWLRYLRKLSDVDQETFCVFNYDTRLKPVIDVFRAQQYNANVVKIVVGEDIPAVRVGNLVLVRWPRLWQGTPDQACQLFGSYFEYRERRQA